MHRLVIEAGRTEKHYWADLWPYRELFYIFAWRDFAVRYKQTVAGALWTMIQPLLNMLIFTVTFAHLAKLPDGNARGWKAQTAFPAVIARLVDYEIEQCTLATVPLRR